MRKADLAQCRRSFIVNKHVQQHQPIDARRPCEAQTKFSPTAFTIRCRQQKLVAARCCSIHQTCQHLRQCGVGQPSRHGRQCQTQRIAAPTQTTRRKTRLVLQRGNGVQHTLPGCFGHRTSAVQHIRNSSRRHPCLLCNLFDCRGHCDLCEQLPVKRLSGETIKLSIALVFRCVNC